MVKYKCIPATHILVIMISPEECNRKPYYTLPAQCLAYTFLGDMAVHKICDKLVEEMISRGMWIAGKYFNIILI